MKSEKAIKKKAPGLLKRATSRFSSLPSLGLNPFSLCFEDNNLEEQYKIHQVNSYVRSQEVRTASVLSFVYMVWTACFWGTDLPCRLGGCPADQWSLLDEYHHHAFPLAQNLLFYGIIAAVLFVVVVGEFFFADFLCKSDRWQWFMAACFSIFFILRHAYIPLASMWNTNKRSHFNDFDVGTYDTLCKTYPTLFKLNASSCDAPLVSKFFTSAIVQSQVRAMLLSIRNYRKGIWTMMFTGGFVFLSGLRWAYLLPLQVFTWYFYFFCNYL